VASDHHSFDAMSEIQTGSGTTIRAVMRDHNGSTQEEDGPDRAQAKIVVPDKVTPSSSVPKLSRERLWNNFVAIFLIRLRLRLCHHFYLVAEANKLFRQETSDGFDPTKAGRKGMG
jgi:hypothetical protein